jgi:hypothetical protein
MSWEKEELLRILKLELEFVEAGGYRTPQRAAWRPQFIFEDSPTCLNYRNFGERLPCEKCALIEFVPNELKKEKFPCRHIPLDESGQTLYSLYRNGTEEETHAIVENWLRTTIRRFEREQASAQFHTAAVPG